MSFFLHRWLFFTACIGTTRVSTAKFLTGMPRMGHYGRLLLAFLELGCLRAGTERPELNRNLSSFASQAGGTVPKYS